MKRRSDDRPKALELVVTEKDYEDGLKRGWTDDDMLKPGRYEVRHGDFLERHPVLKPEERKSA